MDLSGEVLLSGSCNAWCLSPSDEFRLVAARDHEGQLFEIGLKTVTQLLEFRLLARNPPLQFLFHPPQGKASLQASASVVASVSLGTDNPRLGCFQITEEVGSQIVIKLRFKSRYFVWYEKKESPAPGATAEGTGDAAPADVGDGEQSSPKVESDWEFDPMEVFAGNERLRLAGGFCQWKLKRPGLLMEPHRQQSRPDAGGWREHRLCARVNSGRMEFQVVSEHLGFWWRLYPTSKASGVLSRSRTGSLNAVEAAIGGVDDGHGLNFEVNEEPLTVVTISVWLQDREAAVLTAANFSTNKDQEEAWSCACAGARQLVRARVSYMCKDTGLSVAITENEVQCPPEPLDPLSYEKLKHASPKEQERRQELRNALIRKVCVQLSKEYVREDVQQQVLALRQVYPHGGQEWRRHFQHSEEKHPIQATAAQASTPALPAPAVLPALTAPEHHPKIAEQSPENDEKMNEKASSDGHSTPRPDSRHFDFDALSTLGDDDCSPQEDHTGNDANEAEEWEALLPRLVETFGALTGWAGPLTNEIWTEIGMVELAEVPLPEGGLASWEDLAGLLYLCAAADVSRDREAFWASRSQENGRALPQEEDFVHWRGSRAYLAHMSEAALEEADDAKRFRWKLLARRAALQEETQAVSQELARQPESPWEAVLQAQREVIEEQVKVLDRVVRTGTWHDHLRAVLFGSSDELFERAVQRLPAVRAARLRAVATVGLPATQVSVWKALNMGEERHQSDIEVREANLLSLWLLRCFPAPAPETFAAAARAIEEQRIFTGGPWEWRSTDVIGDIFVDGVPRAFLEAESLYKEKAFVCRFGGRKAGQYLVTTSQEVFGLGMQFLGQAIIEAREVLRGVVKALGEEGKELKVERRALLAFHLPGEQLPPWQEAAGSRTRKLALVVHLSAGQTTIADGGELRLHRIGGRCAADDGTCSEALAVPDVTTLPAGFGHWACFRAREFLQEVGEVHAPRGRCHIVVCAGESAGLSLRAVRAAQAETEPECACCRFPNGALRLPCPAGHHVCQECLQREARRAPVPTCPACANGEEGRLVAAARWRLLDCEPPCCLCAGQGLDPGARVVVTEEGSSLRGRLGEVLWWDLESQAWEVRVFATGRFHRLRPAGLALAGCCGQPQTCPGAWPGGRGIWPVSLGSRCIVKMGIDRCSGSAEEPVGYPYFHGADFLPFDSLVTRLQAVLFFLRHDFWGFSSTRNVNTVAVHGFSSRMQFENHRSAWHSFPHHHPVNDWPKFERRIQRFRLLCEHSRSGRAARTLVFVRFFLDSGEFALLDELYATLRLWAGGHLRLVVVAMLQTQGETPKLYRHACHPRVLIYLIGEASLLDSQPISEVCRWAVFDEAGLLGDLPIITLERLCRQAVAFSDPHTEGWLLPWEQKDQTHPLRFPDAVDPPQASDTVWAAARLAAMDDIKQLVGKASVNAWDDRGHTLLHEVACAEGELVTSAEVIRAIANLLLLRADPGCRNSLGETPADLAHKKGASQEVLALLLAASASASHDEEALHCALQTLQEPQRSNLALVLGYSALELMPGGEELAMGNEPSSTRKARPEASAAIEALERELRLLERAPGCQRRRALKMLLLRWHPDRHPAGGDEAAVASEVFQALQARRAQLLRC